MAVSTAAAVQPCSLGLTLPRILCLHGGGCNARIFRAQCRALNKQLSPYFNLVFADGPFASEPGPDVTPVYQDFGPYCRWLPPSLQHPNETAAEVITHIDQALLRAIEESDRQCATGDWVAILGFSQGGKLAASLLLRQQLHHALPHSASPAIDIPVTFRFAVLLAGSAPLLSVHPSTDSDPTFVRVSHADISPDRSLQSKCQEEHLLRLPTIHVHGLQDPGIARHQALMEDFCSHGARLLEWDGNHRVPIKTKDVMPLMDAILDTAHSTGVLR